MYKLSLVGVLLALASPAAANVLVGAPADNSNCIPFGCDVAFSITQYQQLYSAADFASGVIDINALTFFDTLDISAGQTLDNGNFTVSLSTVSTSLAGFTSIIAPGSDNTQIFSGTLPALTATTLTLGGGGMFLYNPAAGNLLLNITISGATTDGTAYLDSRNGTAVGMFSRQTNGTNTATTGFGLVTQFQTVAPSVPEPATFFQMGGLAFMVLAGSRAGVRRFAGVNRAKV